MAVLISPNMNLPIPAVGTEAGPLYATDINSSLTIVDQHNHSPGSGVAITPNGLNINTSLSFANNLAIDLAGLTLVPTTAVPAVNTIYDNSGDLYFVDSLGNNIQITKSGAVAGTPGSIANLVSPASATYVSASKTFVWQSGTSIAANLDAASILLRNITPNSTNALTLQPPAALSTNYSLTLPTIPAGLSLVTIDTSGILSGSIALSGGIPGSAIANNTITEANMGPLSIGTPELINASVTQVKRAALGQIASSSVSSFSVPSSNTAVTNLTVTITTTGRPVFIGLNSNGSPGDLSVVSGTLALQIQRTGFGAVGAWNMGTGTNGTSVSFPVSSVWVIDVPAAGPHTYTVIARYDTLSSGGAAIEQCFLIAYEL